MIGDFRPSASDALLDWALAYATTGMRVRSARTTGCSPNTGSRTRSRMTPRERWARAGDEERLHRWRA